MPAYPELYDLVIKKYYDEGYRKLRVLTGYASSSFVHHLIYSFPQLELDVILGMVKHDNISIWDHNEYVNLAANSGRLRVRYYKGAPPIHSKIFIWCGNHVRQDLAFAGSANLSWNGFKDFQEIMTEAAPTDVMKSFPSEADLVDCTASNVFQLIPMSFQRTPESTDVNTSAINSLVGDRPFVTLPLVMLNRGREVHPRSGLNWGQRPGREPNQAYISIPKEVHRQHPGFLPARKREFNLITDDGESFVCVVAQANDKALESSHDNSILGKYFRKRLGIPMGGRVETQHLRNYGKDEVEIYKIDDETYYLDFNQRG